MKKTSLSLLMLATLSMFLGACSVQYAPGKSKLSGSTNPEPAAPVDLHNLVSIAVSPTNPSVFMSETVQFHALGTYSNNTTADLTNAVTWSSSDTTNASITAGALATGLNIGYSTIKATVGTISGSTTLKVKTQVLYLPGDAGVISMYEIDHNTGQLSFIPPQVILPVGSAIRGIELHPNGEYAYVSYTNTTGSFIDTFAINQKTGFLTQIDSLQVSFELIDFKVDSSGHWLFATTLTNDFIKFEILANGLLQTISYGLMGGGNCGGLCSVVFLTFHPSEPILYLNKVLDHLVESYRLDSVTGNLVSLGSPVASVSGTLELVVNPTENVMYMVSNDNGTISIFLLTSNHSIGNLLNTYNTVSNSMRIGISHSKNRLHVLGVAGTIAHHNITGQSISALGTQVPTGMGSWAMTYDPMGKFLYVPCTGDNKIYTYSVDGNTGELSNFLPPTPAVVPMINDWSSIVVTATIPGGGI